MSGPAAARPRGRELPESTNASLNQAEADIALDARTPVADGLLAARAPFALASSFGRLGQIGTDSEAPSSGPGPDGGGLSVPQAAERLRPL